MFDPLDLNAERGTRSVTDKSPVMKDSVAIKRLLQDLD